jgi:hemerythrin-like domain-containing protein
MTPDIKYYSSGRLYMWKCVCGTNTGGIWYKSLEEAQKRANKHLERNHSRMTTITDHLREEHVKIKDLLAGYDGDEHGTLTGHLAQIKEALQHHTEEEESGLYEAAKQFAEGAVHHALEEHKEADELLAALEGNPTDMQLFNELREAVEHHIDEEENEFFPLCEANITPDVLESLYEKTQK